MITDEDFEVQLNRWSAHLTPWPGTYLLTSVTSTL